MPCLRIESGVDFASALTATAVSSSAPLSRQEAPEERLSSSVIRVPHIG